MSIFGFGIPKASPVPPKFSWGPFLVMGVMLLAALGLRIYSWIQGPDVPTADVPSVTWNTVQQDAQIIPNEDTESPEETAQGDVENFEEISDGSSLEETDNPLLPAAINLAVPFTSQAPKGIWDDFTEETCEEASFLMALAYYKGKPEGMLDPAWVDGELHAMVDVENGLGYGISISTAQFTSFAQAYADTSARIIENPTTDDLRTELAAGNPVIVPAYGRKLGNPFFTGEGPLYHMLVLRGYTTTTFIANDPGTRHGENYQYTFDVLMNAIGDWDGDSPDGGARVMVLEL